MNRWVTTAGTEIEADIIVGRLADAGIHAWTSDSLWSRTGLNHPYDIYVDDADLDAAKLVLVKAQEDIDEGELARLAEEAGRSCRPRRSSAGYRAPGRLHGLYRESGRSSQWLDLLQCATFSRQTPVLREVQTSAPTRPNTALVAGSHGLCSDTRWPVRRRDHQTGATADQRREDDVGVSYDGVRRRNRP
jgi:hypothetical protein